MFLSVLAVVPPLEMALESVCVCAVVMYSLTLQGFEMKVHWQLGSHEVRGGMVEARKSGACRK